MMKTLFFAIVGLLCLSTVATAELSVEDLEKIRQIVNETEGRLEKRIAETEGHLGQRMAEQSKRLDFQGTLIITLIGALIAFVGVPLALICVSAEQTHTTRGYHKSTSHRDPGIAREN